MNQHTTLFRSQCERFGVVVDGVPVGAWENPSPCEGWSAADVVGHVVDTERDFFARHDAALDEPQLNEHDPTTRWSYHLAAVRYAADDDALMALAVDGFFGPTTVGDVLTDFYCFDLAVHRWDLGRATGQEVTWTDEELDWLEPSLDAKGDALYEMGASKAAIDVGADASRQVRLLARLGRDAR